MRLNIMFKDEIIEFIILIKKKSIKIDKNV